MNLTDALLRTATEQIAVRVGALGGLVVDIAPEIGRWLFGATGERTAGLVTEAVEVVTGTADADKAREVLAQDTAAVCQLRIRLAMIAAQQQAEADRATEAQRAADFAELRASITARVDDAADRQLQNSRYGLVGNSVLSKVMRLLKVGAATAEEAQDDRGVEIEGNGISELSAAVEALNDRVDGLLAIAERAVRNASERGDEIDATLAEIRKVRAEMTAS